MSKRKLIYLTGFSDAFPESIHYHLVSGEKNLQVGAGHRKKVIQQIKPLVCQGYELILDRTPKGRIKPLSEEARIILETEGLIK